MLPSTRSVAHKGKMPSTSEASFVAPNASVIGDVKVSHRRGVQQQSRPASPPAMLRDVVGAGSDLSGWMQGYL